MPKRSTFVNTAKKGRADLGRLRRVSDAEIARTAPDELPLLPDDFWKRANVVAPVTKEAISFRVDADVLEWFRAGGPRYQSRMNAVLRTFVEEMARPAAASRSERPARPRRSRKSA